MLPDPPKLAFLGCGNMGGAILSSVLQSSPRAAARVWACDPDEAKLKPFAEAGATPTTDAVEAVRDADVIVLATKPQIMEKALAPLRDVAADKLFVSIAAGITGNFLAERLPGARIIRTMPNTPVLAGKGAIAVANGPKATEADVDYVVKRLFAGSLVVEMHESQIDAATAVSGSGPAYFFAFVEALAAAGAKAGLPADDAMELAKQTLIGAAALLEQTGEEPAELRRRVTSPGGTTAAALAAFEAGGLADLVDQAVTAADRRGRELAAGG